VTATQPESRAALRRSLGLWQLTVSGVGIVIGAGIYVIIGEAAASSGNLLWLSFIVAALLAGLTAMSYAELAGLFPRAGAEYEFARRAFNEFAGFMAGWMMIGANLVAVAAVSIGFAHYVRHFVNIEARYLALALLVGLTMVVMSGVQRSIWLSVVLVLMQIGGLLLVIAAGAPHVGDRSLIEGAALSGVLGASALVFFAFIGFDEIVTLSEETNDAARVVPRALLLALGISTLLYIAVGVVAVSAVGANALAASDRPLALVMESAVGSSAGSLIAVLAIAATMNTSLLALTAASRLIYAMARGGALPGPLSRVGPRGRAPWVAALAGFAVAAPFALSGSIGLVVEVTNFAVYAIFIGVNLAVIRLRVLLPRQPRTFRIPLSVGPVPVTAVLAIATTAVMTAYLQPAAWALGALMVGGGVLAWLIGPHVGRQPVAVEHDSSS
jgi:basic amino acid/polyamine antiporter, APA family